MTTRVILAEDHQMFRDALGHMLSTQPEIEVVGWAGNGQEAVDLLQKHSPDILVMDIGMPRMNGIEATGRVRSSSPDTQVIILSRYSDPKLVVQALKAGAQGYLLKNDAIDQLLAAIDAVQKGHIYLSPAVLRPIVNGYLEWAAEKGASPLARLTGREREVLQLVAEGKSNSDIAQVLELGVRTIESHRAGLMSKLDIHNVAELVRFAFQHQVIDMER